MPRLLENKHIVIGVSGSIACHKAVDLASKLTQEGALIDVVMTPESTHFVGPTAFQSITHRPVATNLFNPLSTTSMEHIALAQRADAILVAPATANTIAKLALGLSDDMLSSTVLASSAPVIVCPAMDGHMYQNAATQENIKKLEATGKTMAGPRKGHLASGMTGPGRMLEVSEIIGYLKLALGRSGDLSGRKILITAGCTREAIDPVRFISNHSSGKMGYAIAEAARDRGANTTIIAGPNSLPEPVGVVVTKIVTAKEMLEATVEKIRNSDVLIMAAAVADWSPSTFSSQKLKKGSAYWELKLKKTTDILTQVRNEQVIKVGFAAESENLFENATTKLKNKNLDLIAANDITAEGSGFESDTNRVFIIDSSGIVDDLGTLVKYEVGWHILSRVSKLLS